MQSRFYPNSTNSLQLSFDGSPSTLHFVSDLSIRSPLKLEQHDRFHRLVRNRIEQVVATLGNFSQDIGRQLVVFGRVDARYAESGFSAFRLLSPVENGGAFRGKMAARGIGDRKGWALGELGIGIGSGLGGA